MRLRAAIAAGGVLVSVGLLAAGVNAMPAGTEYGPSFSTLSVVCFGTFFALNPLHLLLLFTGLPLRGPSAGLIAVSIVDLAWWWFASGALARFIAARRASRRP